MKTESKNKETKTNIKTWLITLALSGHAILTSFLGGAPMLA